MANDPVLEEILGISQQVQGMANFLHQRRKDQLSMTAAQRELEEQDRVKSERAQLDQISPDVASILNSVSNPEEAQTKLTELQQSLKVPSRIMQQAVTNNVMAGKAMSDSIADRIVREQKEATFSLGNAIDLYKQGDANRAFEQLASTKNKYKTIFGKEIIPLKDGPGGEVVRDERGLFRANVYAVGPDGKRLSDTPDVVSLDFSEELKASTNVLDPKVLPEHMQRFSKAMQANQDSFNNPEKYFDAVKKEEVGVFTTHHPIYGTEERGIKDLVTGKIIATGQEAEGYLKKNKLKPSEKNMAKGVEDVVDLLTANGFEGNEKEARQIAIRIALYGKDAKQDGEGGRSKTIKGLDETIAHAADAFKTTLPSGEENSEQNAKDTWRALQVITSYVKKDPSGALTALPQDIMLSAKIGLKKMEQTALVQATKDAESRLKNAGRTLSEEEALGMPKSDWIKSRTERILDEKILKLNTPTLTEDEAKDILGQANPGKIELPSPSGVRVPAMKVSPQGTILFPLGRKEMFPTKGMISYED